MERLGSRCDFIYSRSPKQGEICQNEGGLDVGGRVRCKAHRIKRLGHLHPNRFINIIKKNCSKLDEEGTLPKLTKQQIWAAVSIVVGALLSKCDQ